MTYQPAWDIDKARGEEAEALFTQLRSDIISGRVEVKRDDRARETGNVYVEYTCKRKDGWHLSGISTTTAETWAIHIEPILISIPVVTLKALCRQHWTRGHRRECVVGSHPTKGVIIPVDKLLPDAIGIHHSTAEGAPTDEPPPLQPADTDPDAALDVRFGDPEHPDTYKLPSVAQSREIHLTGTWAPDPEGWTVP